MIHAGAASAETAALAKQAAVWALPYVLFGRYLALGESAGAPKNRFIQENRLSSPQLQVRGCNVDTLYGHGWLDLSDGPLLLGTPDAGSRYYSIQFVDVFQSTLGYVGNHTSGSNARKHVIVGPDWTGPVPDRIARIDSPSNHLLACTRTRVDGPEDLEAAWAVHGKFRLGGLADGWEGLQMPVLEDCATGRFPYIDFRQEGAAFFDDLCALLTKLPIPAREEETLDRFAALGITPGARPSSDADLVPILAAAMESAVAEVRGFAAKARTRQGNWFWGEFGRRDIPETDPLLRAAVNYQGPAMHVDCEAIMVLTLMDAEGQMLNGSASYHLHFPPGGAPPVKEFWSITMYTAGDMVLVDNPIDCYAIGSGIRGLVWGEDGSLDVRIQHARPDNRDANWLPTPEGPFMLLARLYRPEPALLSRTYQFPPIERIT